MMDTRRLSRRHALRVAGAAAAFVPIRAMPTLRPTPAGTLLDNLPICRVADTLPAAGPAKKLTWNANAICTAGVPVADQRGIFARHGLGRGADQLRRQHGPIIGSDQRRQGGCRRGHGAALAEAAGAGL